MNLQKLAEEITKQEGKKVSISIGQVKEVLRLVLRKLKSMTLTELADTFKRQK